MTVALTRWTSPARQPKDAFDLHQIALHYDGGPAAVITGFVAEREANSGFAAARAALEKHFASRDANGPLRGAAFVAGENRTRDALDDELRFREELVNFAHTLPERT